MTELVTTLSTFVAMANANKTLMDGTTKPVRQIIEDNDVVLAVWQDFAQPFGIGTLTIKGAAVLRNISADGVTSFCRANAIPCDSYEQAVALLEVLGEPDTLN
ncbi:hypothetical protein J4G43_004910 [Bradyrhizobium barranii subsp. barranii]|uniref:Uncharacterized protein n=1 Tax=Bradyrhizobium barranii subsp. barranii TaxID=2823807 RepID=A0A939M4T4_9BRAD|nr:hypothetical protein [Bradyrhizobium barranii]UEM13664.1 hypothetical protein J4G43_004910 [Bradyrhizobium barranii subsp. barranii]